MEEKVLQLIKHMSSDSKYETKEANQFEELWVARDMDGSLHGFNVEPELKGLYYDGDTECCSIPQHLFPSVTFKTGPRRVICTLEPDTTKPCTMNFDLWSDTELQDIVDNYVYLLREIQRRKIELKPNDIFVTKDTARIMYHKVSGVDGDKLFCHVISLSDTDYISEYKTVIKPYNFKLISDPTLFTDITRKIQDYELNLVRSKKNLLEELKNRAEN